MKDIVKQIIQARLGGAVERCHIIRHQGSYSNAAHSWGVAMLLWYLFPKDFKRLVLACLTHDVPEGWTGDVPSPTLKYVPHIKVHMSSLEASFNKSLNLPVENELEADDYIILKVCDRLEFYLWCQEQVMMGNQFVAEPRQEVARYLNSSNLPGASRDFWKALKRASVIPDQASFTRQICEEQS